MTLDGVHVRRTAQLPTSSFPKQKDKDVRETNETFTERVDVTTQPYGAFIGTLEIDARPGDPLEEQVRTLQDECDWLRGRVAELEALLAEVQA